MDLQPLANREEANTCNPTSSASQEVLREMEETKKTENVLIRLSIIIPYSGFVSSGQTFGFFVLQASKAKIKRPKSEYYIGVIVHRIRQSENKTDEVGYFRKARKFGRTKQTSYTVRRYHLILTNVSLKSLLCSLYYLCSPVICSVVCLYLSHAGTGVVQKQLNV